MKKRKFDTIHLITKDPWYTPCGLYVGLPWWYDDGQQYEDFHIATNPIVREVTCKSCIKIFKKGKLKTYYDQKWLGSK